LNLRVAKRMEHDLSTPWAGEESKMQSPRSPASVLNVAGGEKTGNQSFRINDSTDSLMENPLTTVIKQF